MSVRLNNLTSSSIQKNFSFTVLRLELQKTFSVIKNPFLQGPDNPAHAFRGLN